jgi:hypothetical protein
MIRDNLLYIDMEADDFRYPNPEEDKDVPNYHVMNLETIPSCADFVTRYNTAIQEIIWWSRELSTNENQYTTRNGTREKTHRSLQLWIEAVNCIIFNPYFKPDWNIPEFKYW